MSHLNLSRLNPIRILLFVAAAVMLAVVSVGWWLTLIVDLIGRMLRAMKRGLR